MQGPGTETKQRAHQGPSPRRGRQTAFSSPGACPTQDSVSGKRTKIPISRPLPSPPPDPRGDREKEGRGDSQRMLTEDVSLFQSLSLVRESQQRPKLDLTPQRPSPAPAVNLSCLHCDRDHFYLSATWFFDDKLTKPWMKGWGT